MRFYVHGAGRAGRSAWPRQSESDGVFADHSTAARVADKLDLVVVQSPGAPIVIAHSLGAVPVALGISTGRLRPSQVILLEPALYDLARGHEAIEHHIATIMHARQHAESGDLFAFWREFSAVMFGSEPALESWDTDRSTARRTIATSNRSSPPLSADDPRARWGCYTQRTRVRPCAPRSRSLHRPVGLGGPLLRELHDQRPHRQLQLPVGGEIG